MQQPSKALRPSCHNISFLLSPLSRWLPFYTQMMVFPSTLKRTEQKTSSSCLALPEHSVHTQMHTADAFVRNSILFFSLFFLCGRIYFLITLFKSILVLSPSEGECLRKGGVPIVKDTELMFRGDWIDALSLEDQCKPCKIHIYLRFLLRSTTCWEEIKLGDNLSLQTCVSHYFALNCLSFTSNVLILVSVCGDPSEELVPESPLRASALLVKSVSPLYTNQSVLWFGLQLFSQA